VSGAIVALGDCSIAGGTADSERLAIIHSETYPATAGSGNTKEDQFHLPKREDRQSCYEKHKHASRELEENEERGGKGPSFLSDFIRCGGERASLAG